MGAVVISPYHGERALCLIKRSDAQSMPLKQSLHCRLLIAFFFSISNMDFRAKTHIKTMSAIEAVP